MLLPTTPFRSRSARRGSTNRAVLVLIASAAVLILLSLLLSRGPKLSNELTVYCAAGLREPMEAIRKAYAQERGVSLSIQYGGSSTLLASLQTSAGADLFLPADESYMEPAIAKGLVAQTFAIAQMRPILAVKKSNPLHITSLDDLLASNLRISMTDPAAAATGKLVESAFQRAGKWDTFKARVTVFKASVSEVAADLQVGAADAGIIWDAMLHQLPEFKEAALSELSGVTARVVAGVAAKKKKHAPSALDLAEFLAAPDKGQRFFQESGFAAPTATEAAR